MCWRYGTQESRCLSRLCIRCITDLLLTLILPKANSSCSSIFIWIIRLWGLGLRTHWLIGLFINIIVIVFFQYFNFNIYPYWRFMHQMTKTGGRGGGVLLYWLYYINYSFSNIIIDIIYINYMITILCNYYFIIFEWEI